MTANMAEESASVEQTLRDFILKEFLPGEDPSTLQNDTPLISGGVLDSIATIQYASFVERHYGIAVPDEMLNAENMDTLSSMAGFIRSQVGN